MKPRLSDSWRGVIIAVFIGLYGWFMRAPEGSFAVGLLAGAGLQILVLLLRRFVPADWQPQAMYVFEYLVDGVTVLMFALGVLAPIMNTAALL